MRLVKKGKKGIIWVLIYTKAKQEKKLTKIFKNKDLKLFYL